MKCNELTPEQIDAFVKIGAKLYDDIRKIVGDDELIDNVTQWTADN